MNLTHVLQLFLIIPLVGFATSLLIPQAKEKTLSRIAFFTAGVSFLLALIFIALWCIKGFPVLNLKEFSVYKGAHYEFLIDFFFDKITAVYLLVGSFLTFLITIYSRYYLHREQGYKRFFNSILFFYLGYNITIFSGNFETLFLGWEILGMSSFLLIAFYRDRYLPVRNAVKVFSIYRIGDVGILLAMWASHRLWHENITFLKLNNQELVHEHLLQHSWEGIFISLMLLLAAAAKSAQLPFSSWLPRAMEGPTPSSAIFYGSLSVHFGAFLLMRTYPFWQEQTIIKILIILLGLTTSVVATSISKVQSTIKTQIAYASIAQIGLMFIEIGFGFTNLALFHFVGNAFLRTYQLLISPSVVTYLIREQFYEFKKDSHKKNKPQNKLKNTLYVLAVKEWNLDALTNKILFTPLKKIGQTLNFLTISNVLYVLLPAYALSVVLFLFKHQFHSNIYKYFPEIFSLVALTLVLRSFSARNYPRLAWILIFLAQLWIALAVSFNEKFNFSHIVWFLSGSTIAFVVGLICLYTLRKNEKQYFNLKQYYGHGYEHPKLAFVFLMSAMALMGFPITPSFIGEDLLLSHIHQDQVVLAFFVAFSYIMSGIAIIRIYARLFLGNHIKTYHETALKSS